LLVVGGSYSFGDQLVRLMKTSAAKAFSKVMGISADGSNLLIAQIKRCGEITKMKIVNRVFAITVSRASVIVRVPFVGLCTNPTQSPRTGQHII
jgi:hypothetical protein